MLWCTLYLAISRMTTGLSGIACPVRVYISVSIPHTTRKTCKLTLFHSRCLFLFMDGGHYGDRIRSVFLGQGVFELFIEGAGSDDGL